MATSLPGGLSSTGYIGLQPVLGKPVGENHTSCAIEPALTSMEQTAQDKLINQISKLTVRPLVDILGLGIDKLPGFTSTL